jgi:ammonia channel protein AmtB
MLSTLMAEGPPYFEQVSTNIFLNDIFYMICAAAIVVGIVGTTLVDAAIVRKKNQVDTWIQKVVGMMIAVAAFFIIGFGIWMWQYYEIFGFANPLKEAIKDWWFAGNKLTNASTFFNPKDANPSIAGSNFEVDVFQVFLVF